MKTGLLENETLQVRTSRNPASQSQSPRGGSEIKTPDPKVSIDGNQYLVDFGQGMSPRLHKVSKNKECSCGARYCEAIEAVRQYLQAGGLRAPDPEGMPPCPICGGKTYPDRTWDGKFTRTLGWRCQKGGLSHFLEAKAERIKQQLVKKKMSG